MSEWHHNYSKVKRERVEPIDKKILVEISTTLGRVEGAINKVETQLSNHLRHHWAATLAILTAFLGLCAGLIIKLVSNG